MNIKEKLEKVINKLEGMSAKDFRKDMLRFGYKDSDSFWLPSSKVLLRGKEVNVKGKLTVEDFLYFQEEVIKWNEVFGNSRYDKTLISTYHNLTKEEFYGKREYLDSVTTGNLVGELDGLIDMIFTGFFLAVLCDNILSREHCQSLLNQTLCNFDEEDLDTFLSWDPLNNSFMVREALIDLLIRGSNLFNIRGAFDRVLESNYSKAVDVREPINITEELFKIEKAGRYAELSTNTTGGYIIIKAHKDLREGKEYLKGKIIKSSLFKSPEDLGGLDEFIY